MTLYDVELPNGKRLGLRSPTATEAILVAFILGFWEVRFVPVEGQ